MSDDKPWVYRPAKRVPFRELPETGVGAIVATAIRGELEARGHSEDVDFTFTPIVATKRCFNCGESKPAARMAEDGWCLSCAGEA